MRKLSARWGLLASRRISVFSPLIHIVITSKEGLREEDVENLGKEIAPLSPTFPLINIEFFRLNMYAPRAKSRLIIYNFWKIKVRKTYL